MEAKLLDGRGAEPNGMEARLLDGRGAEPNGMEARLLDGRGAEPNGMEARLLDGRGAEPNGMEARLLFRHGVEAGSATARLLSKFLRSPRKYAERLPTGDTGESLTAIVAELAFELFSLVSPLFVAKQDEETVTMERTTARTLKVFIGGVLLMRSCAVRGD